jgi:hypothetical protein
MSEFLIIMEKGTTTEQTDRVLKAVRSDKGKVQQRYPPRIIIGRDGEDVAAKLRALEGVSAVHTSPVENPEALALDRAGLLTVRAWNLRHSDKYRSAKATRRIEGRGPLDRDVISSPAALGVAPTMTGNAAVGVVVVEGPPDTDAEFSSDEETLVAAEVQEGIDKLTSLAPLTADLRFVSIVEKVTLLIHPDAVESEQGWLDGAMDKLGYAGIDAYLGHLHDSNRSAWEYIAFFTKYATRTFAYTPFLGAHYCVIQYPEDPMRHAGYSPTDMDQLFAHETGHICGAPHCGPDGDVTCLMSSNIDFHVCPTTANFFGWKTEP